MFIVYSLWNDCLIKKIIEPHCEKTGLRVSDLVRHKLGCIATENCYRLKISDLGTCSRGIVLSV